MRIRTRRTNQPAMSFGQSRYRARRTLRGGPRRNGKARLLLALVVAGFSLCSYLGSKQYNPVTGESQHVSITPRQEIALGLQAAPTMIQQHGGHYPDERLQTALDRIGNRIVQRSDAAGTDWEFDFHLLADEQTVNAFALPGGQVFITMALFRRLGSESEVAGVLGHEIAHVIARHGAQRIAKSGLTQGLIGAVVVATDGNNARVAQMVGQLVNMKYGREDELESDRLGVRFMGQAGYDPRSLIQVMKVLAEASGGNQQPEFMSTHPYPENRVEAIEAAIRDEFPQGLPPGLTQ